MTRPIVGIGGWMTAGKDALADFLVEDHGYAKTYMSETLRDALLALNPWIVFEQEHSGEYYDGIIPPVRYADLDAAVGYTAAKENPEVRRLLQALGTEVGRNMLGEDTWVNAASNKILALHEESPVVLTGVRYRNELDMIRFLGGTTIWVARAGLEAPQSLHTSETSLGPEDFEAVVHNDGTLADLRNEAARLHGWLLTS